VKISDINITLNENVIVAQAIVRYLIVDVIIVITYCDGVFRIIMKHVMFCQKAGSFRLHDNERANTGSPTSV